MKQILEPTIEKDKFIFKENVCGGYLQNSLWANYWIKTVWNKDLQLLEITIDGKNVLYFFDKNGKLRKEIKEADLYQIKNEGDWDFSFHKNRALRAKNRHLKYLKIYLGLEKFKEIKKKIFIYHPYYHSDLRIAEKELTKKGTPKFNEHNVPYTEETPEKRKIAEEFNKKYEKWKKYKNKVLQKLFGSN